MDVGVNDDAYSTLFFRIAHSKSYLETWKENTNNQKVIWNDVR